MSGQVLRGALQAGMIGGEGSMGGSTKVKGSVGARLPRCCQEAFKVMEMSGVKRVHWAAPDTQTKALQETRTRDKSAQVRRGGHGNRKLGEIQREGVDSSAEEGEGPASHFASASR
jgi:hypothetical protein